jgi:3-methylfumaryl-CoA hydratase
MSLLTDKHRALIGQSDPPITVEVSRREISKYAIATEQRNPRFIAGDEAPPMFFFGLMRPIVAIDKLRNDGLSPTTAMPDLPLNRTMAGGTKMQLHRPMRAGDELIVTRTLKDIYEKSGRQGPLIFILHELAVVTSGGEPVLEEIQTRIMR